MIGFIPEKTNQTPISFLVTFWIVQLTHDFIMNGILLFLGLSSSAMAGKILSLSL